MLSSLIQAIKSGNTDEFIRLSNSGADIFELDADAHSLRWHARTAGAKDILNIISMLEEALGQTMPDDAPAPAPEPEPTSVPAPAPEPTPVHTATPAPAPEKPRMTIEEAIKKADADAVRELLTGISDDKCIVLLHKLLDIHHYETPAHYDIATQLIMKGTSVRNEPLLHKCMSIGGEKAYRNWPKLALLLIRLGCGTIDDLRRAIVSGKPEIVEALLDIRSLNVNAIDTEHRSLLDIAVACSTFYRSRSDAILYKQIEAIIRSRGGTETLWGKFLCFLCYTKEGEIFFWVVIVALLIALGVAGLALFDWLF